MPSFRRPKNISYFRSYGDLTPRSKPARVFAMVWMIVGVVVLALLSGKLATSLIATQARDTTLYGKEVYLLNYCAFPKYGG